LFEKGSHVFEAYQRSAGDDDVARILGVLRKLGEPAEVVADRLPGSMVRSGTRAGLPLQVLGGILIALFGIPLGFGGVAVLAGILATLSAMMVTYYAVMAMCLLTAAIFVALGLLRIYGPVVWDRLVTVGILQLDWKLAQFLDALSPEAQGVLILSVGAVALAAGLSMLWGGRFLVRGMRFLYSLAVDWIRRGAQSVRRRLRSARAEGFAIPRVSFVK
jgi:hypothetical protein